MCSGVIVMIRTITTITVMSETIATGTFGRASTLLRDTAVDRSVVPALGLDDASASSYGSGRSRANERSAAAPTNRTGTR